MLVEVVKGMLGKGGGEGSNSFNLHMKYPINFEWNFTSKLFKKLFSIQKNIKFSL
jgi:hypothetical protein